MPNCFARQNTFFVPNGDGTSESQILDSITGELIGFENRTGKKLWFVLNVKIKDEDDTMKAYFDSTNVSDLFIKKCYALLQKNIILLCDKEKPIISEQVGLSDAYIREMLLQGVTEGKISMEDLPVLVEFAKGNDGLFGRWALFKEQLENENLLAIKGKLIDEKEEISKAIEWEQAKLNELLDIQNNIAEQKRAILESITGELIFLQGEERPEGTTGSYGGHMPDNLIPITDKNNHRELMVAFEKFKTKKGIYVICDDKIHRIHHAYLEENGRAYLIGSAKEFTKKNPEETKKIVDRILQLLWGDRP